MTDRRSHAPFPALLAAVLLAAGLAAGIALWREWGLLVFYNGGGLGC